jgi:hypothetical protein
VVAVEENAVAVGQLQQTSPLPDAADVPYLELLRVQAEGGRQHRYLVAVDPDVAGLPRAAAAALHTRELKAGVIPGLVGHGTEG